MAAVAVVDIMIAATVAVVAAVIIAHAAARTLAAAGVVADMVIIVAAVAVAAAAARVTRMDARVLAAAMTRLTARVPRRLRKLRLPPRPRQLLRLRLPPSNIGLVERTAFHPPAPPLLVLTDGIQWPQEPLLVFEKRFFYAQIAAFRTAKGRSFAERKAISGRFAFARRCPKLDKSRATPWRTLLLSHPPCLPPNLLRHRPARFRISLAASCRS